MLKDEDIMKRAYTLEEIASTGHSERHAKHCMQSLLINRGFSGSKRYGINRTNRNTGATTDAYFLD